MRGSTSGGPTEVVLWHRYEGVERRSLESLIDRFNSSQDGIEVKGNSTGATITRCQKVLTALAGGTFLDIAYLVSGEFVLKKGFLLKERSGMCRGA